MSRWAPPRHTIRMATMLGVRESCPAIGTAPESAPGLGDRMGVGHGRCIHLLLESGSQPDLRAGGSSGAGRLLGWLGSGADFQKVIGEALEAAVCVIVAWSSNSIRSTWVKSEAAAANGRDALVPVYLEMVPIPVPFNILQTVHLVDWDGDPDAVEETGEGRPLSLRSGSGPAGTRSRSLVGRSTPSR